MAEATASFSCAGCAKTYAWKPALAGRRVKCACGSVMSVPAASPVEEDAGLYDIAPDPAAPDPVMPARSAPVRQSIAAAPAVAYARRETIGESAVDRYFPDRTKDLHIPLALIAAGTVIEVLIAVLRRQGSLPVALARVGFYMIANTILMLLTVLVVAKIRSISFGPLWTALLKLCAISIGPGAVGALLAAMFFFIPFSGLLGWLVGCILYFALIGALFDLDESDTWVVVLSVFIVKLMLLVGLIIFAR